MGLQRQAVNHGGKGDRRAVLQARRDDRAAVSRQAFDQGSGEGGGFRNLDGFHRAVVIDALDGFGRGAFFGRSAGRTKPRSISSLPLWPIRTTAPAMARVSGARHPRGPR